jgi:hypothetical protein
MVKKSLVLLSLLALTPGAAFAAQFTASAESQRVEAGEPFLFDLTLSGAQAKAAPDTSALQRDFIIDSEGQSSNTSIVNGTVTSSIGWELALIPKHEGTLTVPPISIDTDSGTLTTQPVDIVATTAAGTPAPQQQAQPDEDDDRATAPEPKIHPATVLAAVNLETPYKNQPIRYTVTVIARAGVTDIGLDDLKIDNAVVARPDKPEMTDTVEDGRPAKKLRYDFIITPEEPGRLVIPAPTVHGDAVVQTRMPQMFNGDDVFADPMALLRSMGNMAGMGVARPFTASGNPLEVEVKPPAPGVDPWLPLTSLKMEEDWSGLSGAKVGEPLTRKIMELANGTVGNQLPSLEAQQDHADFKVYADKAETGNDKSGEGAIGWREESYTLIPQKSGTLTIPPVTVAWWDLAHNRATSTTLPGRTISVAPGAPGSESVQNTAASPASATPAATAPSALAGVPSWLYAVIAALAALLVAAGIWILRLQRRASGGTAQPVRRAPALRTPKSVPAAPQVNDARTAADLKSILQSHAAAHWNVPANAPLERLFDALPEPARLQGIKLAAQLDAALYASGPSDLEAIKAQCRPLLEVRPARRDDPAPREKLPGLNPDGA